MASIYELKPAFQGLLRPIVRRLALAGFTANQVTIAAMALSFLVGGIICLWPGELWLLLLVPATLFIRMALNAIDGMLAREHDMQTPLGAFLNELGDVFSDAALYLPFALISGINPALVVSVVVLAVISEMTGVIAVQAGASRRYDGPMGKSDRAFVFGALALAIGLGFAVGLWANIILAVMLLLLAITIMNRVRRALEELV
jgi:CDP-diacylglycerol--glycerol-3-phosphate 3-phosphatidyltransferase